jgi:hypothetical protein
VAHAVDADQGELVDRGERRNRPIITIAVSSNASAMVSQ